MCCTIQEQSNFLHRCIGQPSGILFVAPVVELCNQGTLLLVVVYWQYFCLVEVDPGVPQASPMLVVVLPCFESRHVRITSWGTVNAYA